METCRAHYCITDYIPMVSFDLQGTPYCYFTDLKHLYVLMMCTFRYLRMPEEHLPSTIVKTILSCERPFSPRYLQLLQWPIDIQYIFTVRHGLCDIDTRSTNKIENKSLQFDVFVQAYAFYLPAQMCVKFQSKEAYLEELCTCPYVLFKRLFNRTSESSLGCECV